MLRKLKQIIDQMPDSPEKQEALRAYENLSAIEVIAKGVENEEH